MFTLDMLELQLLKFYSVRRTLSLISLKGVMCIVFCLLSDLRLVWVLRCFSFRFYTLFCWCVGTTMFSMIGTWCSAHKHAETQQIVYVHFPVPLCRILLFDHWENFNLVISFFVITYLLLCYSKVVYSILWFSALSKTGQGSVFVRMLEWYIHNIMNIYQNVVLSLLRKLSTTDLLGRM